MRKRGWIAGFLFLVLGGLSLNSDPSRVRLEMIPGFSGSCLSGSWIPLVVLLESSSPFEGELHLSIPLGNPHLLQRSLYEVRRKVVLQPGTPQRIPFTLPLIRREDITVILEAPDYPAQKKIFPLHPAPGGIQLVLGLTRRSNLGLDRSTGYRFQTIHPEYLPVAPEGYSGLQAVVFHDAPLYQISPARAEALIRWITRGGILVTAGEGGLPENLGPALAPLMPFRLFGRDQLLSPPPLPGITTTPLPNAEFYPVFRGTPLEGATALETSADNRSRNHISLQAYRREGGGYVVTSLIDPAAAPYKDWPGLGPYWDLLLKPGETVSLPDFPLEDPLPNLHSQLSMSLDTTGNSEIPRGLIALSPLGLLLIFSFRKTCRPSCFLLAFLTPLLTALLIFFLYPGRAPVYREIQVVRGNLSGQPVTEWVKGNISGRRGERHRIPLPAGLSSPLPNRNESLLLEEDGFVRAILLHRPPWEDREFFFTAFSETRSGAQVETDGASVTGFFPWDPREGWENPLLIGGSRAVTNGILLSDREGVSFKLNMGQGAAAREEEMIDLQEKIPPITPLQRALLDYLINNGELSREDSAPAFYLVAFSQSRPAYLQPEGSKVETESILLVPVPGEGRR